MTKFIETFSTQFYPKLCIEYEIDIAIAEGDIKKARRLIEELRETRKSQVRSEFNLSILFLASLGSFIYYICA